MSSLLSRLALVATFVALATTIADGQGSKRATTNPVDADGTTALHWAVRSNDVQKVRDLLRAGANANAANSYGMTPLILAATNGNAVITQLLLSAGADRGGNPRESACAR